MAAPDWVMLVAASILARPKSKTNYAMAREHDVGRLEVVMDDPERVCLGQCGSDLRAVAHCNLDGERPFR
jgi:hypothetical protein